MTPYYNLLDSIPKEFRYEIIENLASKTVLRANIEHKILHKKKGENPVEIFNKYYSLIDVLGKEEYDKLLKKFK